MANYIGALDQGTTSTRFIVFDKSRRIVASAQKEHQQIYPNDGQRHAGKPPRRDIVAERYHGARKVEALGG